MSSIRHFVEELRLLKARSGLSYRGIERAARRRGDVLPASTVAGALNRDSLPSVDLVRAFVRACGGSDEEVAAWARTHQDACQLVAMPNGHRAEDGIRPRQLPRDKPTFGGRDNEVTRLCRVLRENDDPRLRLVVIHGPPGVGKSALAVRVAHLCGEQFPDGQLYVSLRGTTPGVDPLSPREALAGFLRALGVEAASVPHLLEESAALFRTLVADRRMLLLLDNAVDVAQLLPLLPAGRGSLVLATSRSRLSTLDGAMRLALEPLTPDASRAVLNVLVGDARVAEDPAATDHLARLCGHMPLGLQVAASRLNSRPSWTVGQLADRLTDERQRLTQLKAGDLAVRSSLRVSYEALSRSDDPDERSAARLLAMLGLLPVSHFRLGKVAALNDSTTEETERVIELLIDAHLVEEMTPGWYQLHDLIRLFAQELAAEFVPADAAAAARIRVLKHILATVGHVNAVLYPKRVHYLVPDLDYPHEQFAKPDDAQEWMDSELSNVVAVVRRGLRGGGPEQRLAIAVSLCLTWFLYHVAELNEAIPLYSEVVSVAAALDDKRWEAYAHGCLSLALSKVDRFDEACRHGEREVAILHEIGDRFGEQRAWGNLGKSHLFSNRPDIAVDCLQKQIVLAREVGSEVGEAYAHLALGDAYRQLGRADDAIVALNTAMVWYQKADDDGPTDAILTILGKVYLASGQPDTAIEFLERGLERSRLNRNVAYEIDSLVGLAQAWSALGEVEQALACATDALALVATSSSAMRRAAATREYEAALAVSKAAGRS